MPNRILALDLSRSRLAAVVVESSFRTRTFLAHAIEPRDPERELGEQLRDFLERNRMSGDTILTSLDGVEAGFRVLDLPFRDRRKLAQTVPFELETLVPVPLEEGIVDFAVLADQGEGARVLAAIAPRAKVGEVLAALGALDLDPAGLGFGPLAAMNVARRLADPPTGSYALLCGRGSETILGLRADGGVEGLRILSGSIEESAEGLAGEVVWSLRSLREGSTKRVLESGEELPILYGGTLPAGIDEALARRGLRPQALSAMRTRELPEPMRRDLGELATTIGLVEGHVGDDGALALDFRREEFAYHRRGQEMRGRLGVLGAIAAAAVLLFGVSEVLSYFQLSNRYEAASQRVRRIFEETLPGTPVIDEVSQIREKIGELERRRDQLGGPISVLEALHELSTRAPQDPRMFVEELSFDGPTMLVRAKTSSFEAVETVKKSLSASDLLHDVQVRDPRSTSDGTVEFRLTVSLGEGGDTR